MLRGREVSMGDRVGSPRSYGTGLSPRLQKGCLVSSSSPWSHQKRFEVFFFSFFFYVRERGKRKDLSFVFVRERKKI